MNRAHTLIYDALPSGRKNAVPASVLWDRLDMDPRSGRRLIHEMRERGIPVLSSFDGKTGGLYLPDLDDDIGTIEAAAFIRSMRRRAISSFRAMVAAKRYISTRRQVGIFDRQK